MLDIDCSDERPVEFDAKEILTYFDTLNDAAYRCFCFCVPAQFHATLPGPDSDLPNLKLTGIGYGDMLLIDAGRYIDAAHVGAVAHAPPSRTRLLSRPLGRHPRRWQSMRG